MTYLITGASRGLGLELARLLAREQANLILVAREPTALNDAVTELSQVTDVLPVVADVGQDAERIVAEGVKRFGHIDVLVNNASTVGPSPMPSLATYPWQALQQVLHTNVLAPLHLTQLVLPHGCRLIVNLTSDAGVNAYPGWGGYGLSKAALEHMSRTLAAEVDGIRVLLVDPGDMNTRMHRDAEPGVDLSHLASPAQVARSLVHLIKTAREPFQRAEAQGVLTAVGTGAGSGSG